MRIYGPRNKIYLKEDFMKNKARTTRESGIGLEGILSRPILRSLRPPPGDARGERAIPSLPDFSAVDIVTGISYADHGVLTGLS